MIYFHILISKFIQNTYLLKINTYKSTRFKFYDPVTFIKRVNKNFTFFIANIYFYKLCVGLSRRFDAGCEINIK